ncbi:MAG: adenylate/guanylate cyclase domain-containing protein [Cyanobacteriota bacterium]|nr:adenylate/guanylate cyclase domain-containing protein [Cyanobacteriota bacterium]
MGLRKLTRRLTRRRKKVPLRLAIVLPFLLQVLAAVGLTGYLSWYNGSQAVRELATQLSQEVTARVQTHIQNVTDTPFIFLELNKSYLETGTVAIANFEQLQRLFWEQIQVSQHISTLYIGTPNGNYLQVERGNPPRLLVRTAATAPNRDIYQLSEDGNPTQRLESEPYDPRERPWYQTAVKTGQSVWSPIYLFANPPELGITPAIPLYSNRRELLGVLAIDLTLDQLSDFLGNLNTTQTGQVFIVEPGGEIVASSTRELPYLETPNGRARLLADQSRNPNVRQVAQEIQRRFGGFGEIAQPQQFRLKFEGKAQFVRATRLNVRNGLDWVLVAIAPEAELTGQIRTNTYATIILCVVALGATAVLGIYTSHWIARPIWRLAKASEAIARGKLNSPVPGSRILEFRILTRSLNQMIRHLRRSQIQLADYSRSLEAIVEERTAALRRSEEKFAKAFHSSPDPIVVTTLEDGRILEVNDSFLRNSGYALEEVIDRTVAQLNLLATPDELAHVIEELKEQYAIRNLEAKFRIRSGEIRTVLLSAEAINWDGNAGVLYIANDITDRVAVQEALTRAEARYRSIFENAAEGIFQAAPDGRYVSVNPALVRMYGYESPEELMSNITHTDPKIYVDASDRHKFIELMEHAGIISNLEYRIYRRDGNIMWVSENARAVKDEDGRLLYSEGTIEDITRRKEIEAQLRQQRQYLRLVLDNIPQQVFWKDVDSVFLGCNKNWADAADLDDPEEVIGKTDYDFLPVEAAEFFRAVDRRIIATNRPEYNSIQTKQKPDTDGNPIWLDVSKIPIHDEEGKAIGILGVIEDITLRKIAEEKRQEAEEALRQEREKSEQLLLNILPEAIAEQLKQEKNPIAEQFSDVAILFADIVGFTSLSARLPATELVNFLNQIFSEFDRLAKERGLEKIKTIGDAYMVAGGLPIPKPDRFEAIAEMALAMQQGIIRLSEQLKEPLEIRIGINTGPVVAGVIGVVKFIYDLWGDTVNVASRMESLGEPGRIQTTQAIYERLKDRYIFEKRGEIDVKGKGKMTTYWLLARKNCVVDVPSARSELDENNFDA